MVSCQLRNAALALPRADFLNPSSCPGSIWLDPGIHLLQESWIAGSSSAKTRRACHRAALRADPLALLPGYDDKP
jgi:hypothetical protein